MPMFDRSNITEFFERYEGLCQDYRVTDTDRLVRLPRYCTPSIVETVKLLTKWGDKDYAALKKSLLLEYQSTDAH